MKQLQQFLAQWSPFIVLFVVSAPIWLFFVRLWWEWTTDLLTKPWDQILCIGSGCA